MAIIRNFFRKLLLPRYDFRVRFIPFTSIRKNERKHLPQRGGRCFQKSKDVNYKQNMGFDYSPSGLPSASVLMDPAIIIIPSMKPQIDPRPQVIKETNI